MRHCLTVAPSRLTSWLVIRVVVGVVACIAALTTLGATRSSAHPPLPLEARVLDQGEFERVFVLPEQAPVR